MGEVLVRKDALWGAQTQRSLENFNIGDDVMPSEVIRAFGYLKWACAEANREELRVDVPSGAKVDIASAVVDAAREVAEGKHAEHFPLVVYQTGSGTQTNMNVNEVLANLANERLGEKSRGSKTPVHPNDHVNRGQSTNDAFPTAMHIAAVLGIKRKLAPALQALHRSLDSKADEFVDVIKIGRTHLQDATPITLGQEFSAWAKQVELSLERLESVLVGLLPLPQGGTAVGTGLNTFKGFDVAFASHLSRITGVPFTASPNKFEGIAAHDAFVELAGVQNTIAGSFMKIANDLRLLSSGPTGGLAEIWLPANEPGSSIMPGKVNPTQAEAMSMVSAQVMGNSVAVSVANSHGHLDLQAFKPVIVSNIVRSTNLLADTALSFATNCVSGIEPNREKIQEHLDKNLMLVTALNPVIGYDKAADVAKTALKERKTLKQVAVHDKHYLSESDFDKHIVPANMIAPTERVASPSKEDL